MRARRMHATHDGWRWRPCGHGHVGAAEDDADDDADDQADDEEADTDDDTDDTGTTRTTTRTTTTTQRTAGWNGDATHLRVSTRTEGRRRLQPWPTRRLK